MPVGEFGKIQTVRIVGEQPADLGNLTRAHRVGTVDALGRLQTVAVENLIGKDPASLVKITGIHATTHPRRHFPEQGLTGTVAHSEHRTVRIV